MRTETQQVNNGDLDAALNERTPDELWLDPDITGEQLVELDPLEETEDLLALADEATGDFLQGLHLYPPSPRFQNLITRICMEKLRAKHGKEELADFLIRIRGSP